MKKKRPVYYKIKEVAEMFGASPVSVSRWVDQGKLKAVLTPGGHRRILKADLDKLLKFYSVPYKPDSDT
jgi:excisionase family DNA binding protein